MNDSALERRRKQNLTAQRTQVRAVAPSIRSFGQAIDRQQLERVPMLKAARPDLLGACAALDEAEVAALSLCVDDPAHELAAFAQVAAAASVPVLRTDLLVEEFQIYQSRAAGADAVLLHAAHLEGALLPRLCEAAQATHMAACVLCEDEPQLSRALAARAPIVAFRVGPDGKLPSTLVASVPRRVLVLAVAPDPTHGGPPPQIDALGSRAGALLDPWLGDQPDPAAELRRLLQE